MFYIVIGMMRDRGEVMEMTDREDMTGMITVMTEEGVTDMTTYCDLNQLISCSSF